ncbi:hypothetical protein NKH36_01140 [Mesorhizobium sp. M1312]|uniref:hypothetical protein n=1 Tax=unclassified Mesorhizobium TaxID=325217 RepID=UPI00333B3ED0
MAKQQRREHDDHEGGKHHPARVLISAQRTLGLRLFGPRRFNFIKHVGNPIVEEFRQRSQRLAKKTGAPADRRDAFAG